MKDGKQYVAMAMQMLHFLGWIVDGLRGQGLRFQFKSLNACDI